MLELQMDKLEYETQCQVICTDTGISHLSEVHKHKPDSYLEIVVHGVTVPMPYNGKGLYIGNKFGMEFTSKGPKCYTINRR